MCLCVSVCVRGVVLLCATLSSFFTSHTVYIETYAQIELKKVQRILNLHNLIAMFACFSSVLSFLFSHFNLKHCLEPAKNSQQLLFLQMFLSYLF